MYIWIDAWNSTLTVYPAKERIIWLILNLSLCAEEIRSSSNFLILFYNRIYGFHISLKPVFGRKMVKEYILTVWLVAIDDGLDEFGEFVYGSFIFVIGFYGGVR